LGAYQVGSSKIQRIDAALLHQRQDLTRLARRACENTPHLIDVIIGGKAVERHLSTIDAQVYQH